MMLTWRHGQVSWTVVVVEIYWAWSSIRLVGLVTWPNEGVSLRSWGWRPLMMVVMATWQDGWAMWQDGLATWQYDG